MSPNGDPPGAPLALTERLFRAAIEAAPHGVVVVGHTGTIALVNGEVERIFGYAREELVGRPVELLVPQRFAHQHAGLRAGFGHEAERRHLGAGRDLYGRTKDGRDVPVEIGLSRLETPDGTFVLATIIDISRRKFAENHLRDSEERFRQIADNIKEAFVVGEAPSLQPLYLNHSWQELFGISLEVGYREPGVWFAAIHDADRENVKASMQQLLAGRPAVDAFRIVHRDGSMKWARARFFPVRDSAGSVYRIVGLIEDITDFRRTEEQFLRAQKMEAVGRLAGGVAHDFNNLLTVILGSADLMQDELADEATSRKLLSDIKEAAASGSNLTRQLLAFSRRQLLEPRVIDLNAAIQKVWSMIGRVIGEDVKLQLKLEAKRSRVFVDPGQMDQVLMNLAVNARDAMPHGGVMTIETADIDLDEEFVALHHGSAPGPHVMIAVSDTGVGMTDEVKRRLFEPFFTTKEFGKGTGLGLATVHGIVHQSHGSIWVYSEPGRGTTFKIYLPLSTEDAVATPSRPPVRLDGSETVLVVEDQSEVRSLIAQVLSRRGYRVLEAADGNEAEAVCGRHDGAIDVLLTDAVLPGPSGLAIATRLREMRPAIGVVYMSGYTDAAVQLQGLLNAGEAFIQKPFTAEGLLTKLREVLDAPSRR